MYYLFTYLFFSFVHLFIYLYIYIYMSPALWSCQVFSHWQSIFQQLQEARQMQLLLLERCVRAQAARLGPVSGDHP